MRYLGGPRNRPESDAQIESIEAEFRSRGFGRWAVHTRCDGRFVGMVGLHVVGFDAPFTPAVEIAWRLAYRTWGHGYAAEAAEAAMAYGFGPCGLGRLVAVTPPENARSRRLMERLGMQRDGADDFDHPLLPTGHPLRRHVLYRLSSEEWATRVGGRHPVVRRPESDAAEDGVP